MDNIREEIQKPKTVSEILHEQIEFGLREYRRSNIGLTISAFAAGLEVGFSIFLIGILHTLLSGQISEASLHLITAAAYPVGFILTIIGRSELFTEHTARAALPALNRSVSIGSMLTLWGIVLAGNLAGSFAFALILVNFAPAMGFMDTATFLELARKMVGYDWAIILGSGIGAGWLMGLVSWLVSSSQETFSRVIFIYLITFLIGIGGLHHSIVGSIEVFAGLLTHPDVTFGDFLRFQVWATLGNAIGGVVFVAIIKYSHTKRS